jgi:hypothetical protein
MSAAILATRECDEPQSLERVCSVMSQAPLLVVGISTLRKKSNSFGGRKRFRIAKNGGDDVGKSVHWGVLFFIAPSLCERFSGAAGMLRTSHARKPSRAARNHYQWS